MLLELVLLIFATFWIWETLRAFLRLTGERWFNVTRPGHPLLAAVFPLVVLWPDYVTALAVAGATGLLVGIADHFLGSPDPAPIQGPQRRRVGGLPPLP